MFGDSNEKVDNLQLLDKKKRTIFTNLVNGKTIYYNKMTFLSASEKNNKDQNKYYLSYSEIRDHKEEVKDKIDSLYDKDVYSLK